MEAVESGDTVFTKRGDTPKIVSLSIDQVNDNPDELIELRGEGRYFGASDAPSGILCSNCHQRGHKRADCKTVVCMACGMVDDHYTQHCPKSIVCSNCGEKGHYKNQCTQKQRRVYCQICSSTRHFSDRCTSIWRSYLTVKDEGRKMGLPNNIYCYNCAEKGHYGDECPLERTSRVPNLDGSAFSGHNLPQQLRDTYHSLHKKRKRDYDYDDDSNYGYQRAENSNVPSGPRSEKKNGLFVRIKDTFKRTKNTDEYADQGPSKKKKKQSKKDIRKAQSMPVPTGPAHSGILPRPKTPPAANRPPLDYPRNPNYNRNNGYNQGAYNDYNNNYGNSYNRGGYTDSYSQGYGNNYNDSPVSGYSRSGYLEPSRSGSLNRGGQYKQNNRGGY